MEEIRNISASDFLNIAESNGNYQIIDTRIVPDIKLNYKNMIHIPFDKITLNLEKVSKEKQVIFICDTGANSFFAVKILQQFHNFTNLWNLKGGVDKLIID